LGMSDSMLQLLPKSAVHHIGMYRIPGHAPVQYYNRLPKKCTADIAYVLDPALGSASTMMAVVAQLQKVRKKIMITSGIYTYFLHADTSTDSTIPDP
jgi:uracil phosphoribosyltransferase